MLRSGIPLTQIANSLLERHPGTPLVCDRTIAEEVLAGSVPWIEEDHYRLGIIEQFRTFQMV